MDIKKKLNTVKSSYELSKEISKLENAWIEILCNNGIYNKENLTFTLKNIKKEDKFGWSGNIHCPWGLSLDELEKIKPFIEYGLHCEFLFKIPYHKQFAEFKIVFPNQVKCNDIPFTPVVVKPYELYGGVDASGEAIIYNINFTPHVILAGQTRKGKNGSLDHMVTSLIYSCNNKEIELHLYQCAKNDLIKYKNCNQVKTFILGDYESMEKDLELIIHEIKRRTKLLEPMMASTKGTNIFDYNNLNPSNKLPYIYVIMDEFMDLMLSMEEKKLKPICETILIYLKKIAEFGGALGITYIIAHQKPEKALCPTFLKNMSLIRICFGFDDESCGRIVLGEKYGDLATKLPARKAIYSADGQIDTLYTTNMKDRIKMFISKSEVQKGSEAKFIERAIPKDGKVQKDNFDKVKPKTVEDNIKNIDGYVPYISKPVKE